MDTPNTISEILDIIQVNTFVFIKPEQKTSYATIISKRKKANDPKRFRIRSDRKDLTLVRVWRVK